MSEPRFTTRLPASLSGRRQKQALAAALSAASYEVLPFKSTEEQVLEHVPRSVPITVTTTEAKGLGVTLDLAERLARHGYTVSPHLAARLVQDKAHLADIVVRLEEAGVTGVFVVGGDAPEPVGDFTDALGLLAAMEAVGHSFIRVGIGGYPEGHGHIPQDSLDEALRLKSPLATYLVSQLCFQAGTTATWARRLQGEGVDVPIRVGIPGAVSRQKLVRISAGLGLGQSSRFLLKQQSMLWRFFLPGGYSPNKLVQGLAPQVADPTSNIEGFHIFTFNELAKTEDWRRSWMTALR